MLVIRVGDAAEDDAVPVAAGVDVPILPASLLLHLFADARAHRGIPESLRQRVLARLGVAGVDERADIEAVVHVRVDIDGHVLATGARLANPCECEVHLPPVGLASRLQVEDVDGRARVAADAQCLVDRLEQSIALVAHVREVATAVPAGDRRQRGDLLLAGVHGRWIDERCRHPDGARLHRLFHHTTHALKLRGRSLPRGITDHDLTDRGVPHGLRDVERSPCGLESPKILAHCAPTHRASRPWCDRRGRFALAGVDGGDALRQQIDRDVGRPAREHVRALTHHVDEPGSHDQPRSVDDAARFRGIRATNDADTSIQHSEVGSVRRCPGTVDDPAPADDQVIRRGLCARG